MTTDVAALTDEELQAMLSRAESLAAAADREPTFAADLVEIVARETEAGGDVGPETMDRLYARVNDYLGDLDATGLFMGLVSLPPESQQDLADAVDRLPEKEAELVWAAVRSMRSLYGEQLLLAAKRWAENPDDWVSVRTDVTYSLQLEIWKYQIWLTKYSGDDIHIEGSPTSILNLIEHLMRTFNAMDPDAADFAPETLQGVLSAADRFKELFGPDGEAEQTG